MLRLDKPNGPGLASHHDGVRLSASANVADPVKHITRRDARCRKHHIALGQLIAAENTSHIFNAHLDGAFFFAFIAEMQTALKLATKTPKRRCSQNALWRATDAKPDVDARSRLRRQWPH